MFVLVDFLMEYKKILKYFTDQAKEGVWNDLYNPSNPLSHSFIHRYRKATNLIKIKKNSKILDMGCGTGVLIPFALQNKLKYSGIDNSKEMLDFCHNKFVNNLGKDQLNLFLSDFKEFKDLKNYDIFFGIGFIEYFQDPFDQIIKIFSFLDENKQLILSFPNKFSLDYLMLNLFYIPRKIITFLFKESTRQPPRSMFTIKQIKFFAKNYKGIKIKYIHYNTNIFSYPFTRFFPKFTNYIGNLLEDSFLNKFSFFSSGFIVLFEKEKY